MRLSEKRPHRPSSARPVTTCDRPPPETGLLGDAGREAPSAVRQAPPPRGFQHRWHCASMASASHHDAADR